MVISLLAEHNWTPQSIQVVIVSRGPGSYTGLRVGIMSAKTFAYVTGCALIAVDTFAALAHQVPGEAGAVEVLADAQQARVYVQRFVHGRDRAERQPATPLRIEQLDDWLTRRQPGDWVTGPGLYTYGAQLPNGIPRTLPDNWDPRPESLLQVGLARYLAGERDDVSAVEPLYLRPSAAEQQWHAPK
jgi:tRNA threonylcarbamoyladenosine biosynthesis protein TsaB